MPIEPGQKLAHYRVRSLLGQGGMGAVYRAEDTHLGREVALKVLPDDVAQDPDRLSRFRREARAVAALNHPGIVIVYSVEQDEGTPFITMELVEGEPLSQKIPDTGLPLDDFWPIAEQLSDALAAAHDHGVVHRDIKPANIMVTPEGRTKVLDFGLARVDGAAVEEPAANEAPTQTTTQVGTVLGTPAYMSPEQARGEPADARSDVFALGIVLYEMLTGQPPFRRADGPSTIHAILNDEPPELSGVRREVPRAHAAIVARCLSKDAGERYASAAELREALAKVRPGPAGAGGPAWRVALTVLVPLVVVAALALWWQGGRQSSGQRLRDEAIPRIESLIDAGRPTDAFLIAREALANMPDDPALARLVERTSRPSRVTTDPPGATVEFRAYIDPGASWSWLGTTPMEKVRIPDDYMLLRIRKKGYETALRPAGRLRIDVTLVPEGEAPPGMVRVPAGEAKVGAIATPLEAFWIDRYEVTREAFQAFVDAGGYSDASYWQEPFVDGNRTLDLASAMQRFVDQTGRPGPAGWELGRYPEGTGALPVAGVSWYEAAAYARWAGKELPTIYHWVRAAERSYFSEILELSNFESDGPSADEYAGIGPFGTFDMAGNVKEWCRNAAGDRRYSQGGGWNESPYLYDDFDALEPFDRGVAQGFRLVQYDGPLAAELYEPWQDTRFDFNEIEAVGDELYAFMASLYDYTPTPLEPELELADESSEHWRRETIAIDPAYDGTRLQVHLFLPRNAEPPYQTVLFRPSSIAYRLTRIEDLVGLPDWIPRSGRALVVPALWGALGRQGERRIDPTPEQRREIVVRQVLDYRRAMDYLATRGDIDFDRVAYTGLSSGGEYGALYLAVEPRYRAAVLIAAGFHDEHMLDEPAETNPWNFAPRVTLPTLIINGENDFTLPYETAQKPLLDMLGTPDADKRMALISGGHVTTDRNALIRESLAWLDRYLGPVE